jgi:hypothetical protein
VAGGIGVAGAAYGGYGGYGVAGTYAGGYGGGAYGGYGYGGYGGTFVAGAGGSSGAPAECQACLFQSCSYELNQCFQDLGCLAIFSCAQTTNCGPLQCYTPQTCKSTIDDWGGPTGDSMGRLFSALTCAVQSSCPCTLL